MTLLIPSAIELRLNYILNLIVDKPLETRRIFEQLTYFLFFSISSLRTHVDN